MSRRRNNLGNWGHFRAKAKEKLKRRTYGRRDGVLRDLGFRSYKSYMASEEWRSIRRSQLEDRPMCDCCGNTATQVHHYDYSAECLLGYSRDLLFSVCRKCHKEIEFTPAGQKRRLTDAQKHLTEMLKLAGKTDLCEKASKQLKRNALKEGRIIRREQDEKVRRQLGNRPFAKWSKRKAQVKPPPVASARLTDLITRAAARAARR